MSSTRPDHSEWHELVAGHALHALDDGDELRLQAHLAECDECRAELDGHALTASHLASLADDGDTAVPAWSSMRTAVVGSSPVADVADLAERRDRRQPARWMLAAAAVAVVLAGATVASWQVLRGSGGSTPATSALAQCSATPGCQEIDLRSSSGVRRAAVIVRNGTASVAPIALHSAGSGRTFVLWQLPRSGAPIPLGEFGSTSATSTPAALAVSIAHTTAFAVSSEPADAQPSTPSDVLALGGATA
jgi:hypothetical protein